ncbi:MAG: RlmE family RNA methyltransferase [Bdellovibrionaceae bacterium]|nr:RlmE family RNA methyltransferase [Bdellovibrionales bacterium]MCB9253440.1 RlmE family RNA methyltransferase [Pseudobdellovibrionaceae bacterium]
MSRRRPDSFTKRAKAQDFLARSVFKLEEIDKREKLFQGVETIVDLGAAPGSWTQYCVRRVPKAKIVAIDLNPLKFSHPNVQFVQGSITETDMAVYLDGKAADLVLSDMAPKTTGIHDTDVARSAELAEMALETALKVLRPGGSFVAKLFMGESFEAYDVALKKHFEIVKKLRPESTRKRSREIFFIAKSFRGPALS